MFAYVTRKSNCNFSDYLKVLLPYWNHQNLYIINLYLYGILGNWACFNFCFSNNEQCILHKRNDCMWKKLEKLYFVNKSNNLWIFLFFFSIWLHKLMYGPNWKVHKIFLANVIFAAHKVKCCSILRWCWQQNNK